MSSAPVRHLDLDAAEAFSDLEGWLCQAGAARLGVAEIEREAQQRGREAIRVLFQAHLDGRGDGDIGPAIIVETPDGPQRFSHKRAHTRRLVTLFGGVTVTRVGYNARGQASIHPLDAELQLPARAYSYEICRRLVRVAVCGPFDEAIALVQDTTGVAVPKRSAEQIVVEAAADFEAVYAQRSAPVAKGDILVGAIDGKGIPMVKTGPAATPVRVAKGHKRNKKRMATVAAVCSNASASFTRNSPVNACFAMPIVSARIKSICSVRPSTIT